MTKLYFPRKSSDISLSSTSIFNCLPHYKAWIKINSFQFNYILPLIFRVSTQGVNYYIILLNQAWFCNYVKLKITRTHHLNRDQVKLTVSDDVQGDHFR